MSSETRAAGPGDADTTFAASFAERLLAQCLEHPAGERAAELARLCTEHPEHATELRELAASLATVGLTPADEGLEFPDHLGEFRLLRRLGSGGMGVVFLAEQEPFGRRVAVKLMHPVHTFFPGARERFRREAMAVASLEHPNIVTVHSIGEEHGMLYMVMEWIDGRSLADAIASLRGRRPLELCGQDLAAAFGVDATADAMRGSWTDACAWIVAEVGRALAHAHERGIVHRDVKSSNVMVTPAGRVVLVDFGLATSEQASRLTRSGTQPGSVPYMSPEQVRGEVSIDARSDVYSLGATLYELLTLHLPHLGATDEQTRAMVLCGRPLPVRTHNPVVSTDAEVVCHKALEPRPGDRYPTARAMTDDLGRLLRREPILARPPGPVVRLQKWAQRNPGVATMTSLLILVVFAAYAWMIVQNAAYVAAKTRAEGALAENERVTARLQRLSDRMLLRRLLASIETLPALRVENLGFYERWVAEAEALAQRLHLHQQVLEGLGQEGGAAKTAALQWEVEELRAHIAELEALISPEQGQLEFLRGRITFARQLRTLTIDDHINRWRTAAAAIATTAHYAGVELRPQLGLIPLGADPDSGLHEFLHMATHEGPLPARDGRGRLAIDARCGIVLVLLPGGTFWMGTQDTDPDGPNYDPAPARFPGIERVALQPFFLAKHELTRGQWWRATHTVAGNSPSGSKNLDDLMPVLDVDWNMATSTLTRLDLQLPTEAQWEYACRAGTQTVWSTGSDAASLRGSANLAGGEYAGMLGTIHPDLHDDWIGLSPVGSLQPNGFGLHDMHGNASEWCRDGRRRYGTAPARSGDGDRGATSPDLRAGRGGSFRVQPELATSAYKWLCPESMRSGRIGVRAARAMAR